MESDIPNYLLEQPILQAGISVSSLSFYILSILVLLTCSALISASEIAFFSLKPADKEHFKQLEGKKAESILKLLSAPQDLLATILIFNNFVNVGVVIISTSLLSTIFPATESNEWIRFILEVFAITLAILLIGEVIPKIFATKNGIPICLFMVMPLTIASKIPPFSWFRLFLVNGTNIINRYAKKRGVKISADELEQALALTIEETSTEEEHRILEGIIKFGNTDVRQIMQSRVEVVAVDADSDFKEIIALILDAGYSRMPVYENSIDNVVGILYIKDLLPHIHEEESFDWKALVRKPFFVPENKKIDDLLKEFQSKKMHMAVVVDEYGGANGIVTLEDVLEEIVGDITDEYDDDEIEYTKIDENTFVFEGRTSLVDMYKVMDIDGKDFESEKGESDSIGGFVVEKAGRILRNKEFIKFDKYKLIVESSDKRRIKSVRITHID
jgi:gliding motility-associated protein GldE